MPHCQKEIHDHRSKSKKDRQKKKEAAIAKKKALKEKEEEEEEKAKLSNNIAFAEGFGDYEVGCEAEREYVAKFNLKKRSKKVRNKTLNSLSIRVNMSPSQMSASFSFKK